MAEEKPSKSLTGSSGRESFKTKNPFSRVKEVEENNTSKKGLLMRKSWSTDSLALLNSNRSGKTSCVCAPTKHEGSFRCRLHRSSGTGHGTATNGGLPPATTNRSSCLTDDH